MEWTVDCFHMFIGSGMVDIQPLTFIQPVGSADPSGLTKLKMYKY